MSARYFLFGAGYSALAFARLVGGEAGRVAGTTRSPEKFGLLCRAGVAPLLFDGAALSPEIEAALASATHLVVSAAPGDAGDPLLGAAADFLARRARALRWAAYLSTVGVYGDRGGAWVDEESAPRPASRRSRLRLVAERQWQAFSQQASVPVAILRLPGICGPGRNALASLENGSARRIVKQGQVFNRVHVADIAGALRHLGEREQGGVVNVTDDEPAPPQDVVAYAARLIGVAPPPETAFEDAELSPLARSFYGEAKRVSNARLKATGYRLVFPDYRAALSAMWADGSWRAP